MNHAILAMLEKYDCRSTGDYVNALREIFQEIVLCGLWRAKFWEKAAFYGGTALRVLYGLERFSEDLDFSLLVPGKRFDLSTYCKAVENELEAWGFTVQVEMKRKSAQSAIHSAFFKADTRKQLLTIGVEQRIVTLIPNRSRLKIRIEVDTDPPPGFSTETRFLLQPIPFSVKVYDLPSMFAGKAHALICRRWRTRVKGRDWYDFVWYVRRKTPLDLPHLENRMRHSGHYNAKDPLDEKTFKTIFRERIEELDVAAARSEFERFLVDPSTVQAWSREFFFSLVEMISFRQA